MASLQQRADFVSDFAHPITRRTAHIGAQLPLLTHITSRSLQNQFKSESIKIQEFSAKAETCRSQLARLETQIVETTMVKEEIESIKDDCNVYKMQGPALIKQELVDAKMTIDSRLKYLTTERDRVEKEVEAIQNNTLKAREEIEKVLKQFQQLQMEAQKAQQGPAQPAVPATAAKAAPKAGNKKK